MSRRNARSVQRRLQVQSLESRDLMSADPLPVLLVIANQQHFFYREYNDTRNSILAEGIDVVIGATTTNPSTAHGNSGQGGGSGVVVPDIALANVDAEEYSAIVFVGGWGSSMYQYAFNDPAFDGTSENFYQNGFYNGDNNLNDGVTAPQKVIVNNLINEFLADDKYVAGICHGTTVLAWARVNGVSPINGKQVAVPIKDGSPSMFFNGDWYSNGYVNGQYDHAVANGGIPNTFNGQHGDPNTTTDDVVVDGKIITGGDDFAAAYFGTVIAEQVWANMNQAPTDLALSANSIAENAASGSPVGNLSTTDPDTGDTFAYSLVAGAGSTDNALFGIANGLLQTAAMFDFETQANYSIRVRSTDAGGLFKEKSFAISIANANESPFSLLLSNDVVSENEPAGSTIGNFSANDPDTGDSVGFSLVAGDGSTDNALFNIVNGELQTSASLNYETQDSFSIRVRAADAGGLFTDSIFSISVTNMNESPFDLLLSDNSIEEAQPAGTPVGMFSASDPDAGDRLTYLWEQFDLGPATTAATINTDPGTGPIFRPFDASTSPTRLFPRLGNILAGTQTIGEVLPTVARTLNFRVTARDNRGGVQWSGTATPAVVTPPACERQAPRLRRDFRQLAGSRRGCRQHHCAGGDGGAADVPPHPHGVADHRDTCLLYTSPSPRD